MSYMDNLDENLMVVIDYIFIIEEVGNGRCENFYDSFSMSHKDWWEAQKRVPNIIINIEFQI